MTALAAARQEQRIVDEIHHLLGLNPDHASDTAWMIEAVAYTLDEDKAVVRRIWKDRFADHGVA